MTKSINDFKFDSSITLFKLKKTISEKVYLSFFESLTNKREKNSVVSFKKKEKIHSTQCIFTSFFYKSVPSCIKDKDNSKIKETKLAFFLAFELKIGNNKYIGFQTKNISGLSFFDQYLERIDYAKFISLIDKEAKLRKANMKNTDISNYSLFEKSYTSFDLSKNISGYNLNHYVLSSCRYSEREQMHSITFNTSRCSKIGQKVDIYDLVQWFENIVNEIDKSNNGSSNYLINSFAKYVKYEKGKYTPSAILFAGYKLLNEMELDDSIVIEKKVKSKYINVEYEELLTVLEKTNFFIQIKDNNIQWKELNDKCQIKKAEIFQGLYIKSDKLEKRQQLVKYFDLNNLFTLAYTDYSYRYINGTLYQDSKLLDSIEWVIGLFVGYDDLANVKSEKGWGDFVKDQNEEIVYDENNKRKKVLLTSDDKDGFFKDSEFYFVEDKFMDSKSFFICDDMNDEWADHIRISPDENSVSFYLSKFSEHKLSATAFQDVIGQAQKNIGKFILDEDELKQKQVYWSGNYQSSGFSRMRNPKKKNAEKAVQAWAKIQKHPNYRKEMKLVINFISRKDLILNLNKLKKNENFTRKNEVHQILWFISSFLSSCNEQNISVEFLCKP